MELVEHQKRNVLVHHAIRYSANQFQDNYNQSMSDKVLVHVPINSKHINTNCVVNKLVAGNKMSTI